MEKILVNKKEERDDELVFDVELGETKYIVTVSKEYWKKLTGGELEPEDLVKKSFEFLLARESKESILRKFELPVIQQYFPEYETEIKNS